MHAGARRGVAFLYIWGELRLCIYICCCLSTKPKLHIDTKMSCLVASAKTSKQQEIDHVRSMVFFYVMLSLCWAY